MNAEASLLISTLGLQPLPKEGGYFARTWSSAEAGPGGRPAGSAILFLLTEGDFSAFHRLQRDEVWHFHSGDPVELIVLDPSAPSRRRTLLGPEVTRGHAPQAVVRAGAWQGARLAPARAAAHRGWGLVGCTLAPAWDEGEFELARRDALLGVFPADEEVIRALTR